MRLSEQSARGRVEAEPGHGRPADGYVRTSGPYHWRGWPVTAAMHSKS